MKHIYLGVLAFVLAACSNSDAVIYSGGDILTMNASQPTAEALAVKDGKILAVGGLSDVKSVAGNGAEMRDLEGKTLIPGLIDAHGHFGFGAFVSTLANLQPPPAGPVSTMEDLVTSIANWRAENPKAEWIIGMGYDDSLMEEGRHPTREDLDKISTETPILLIHVSGHLATCNTPCLEIAGVTTDTKAPPGGVIRRVPGTQEPDGVMEETAMGLIMAHMPRPSATEGLKSMKAYQNYLASQGITTAQDGASDPKTIKGMRGLATLGQLKLDVVAFAAIRKMEDFDDTIETSQDYKKGFRVGGVKLFLDGSPQGKTAWLTHPYHVVPEGADADYAGYATMETRDVQALIDKAFEKDVPVLAHANGDAAADQLLNAVTAANAEQGNTDRRTVMIHAQTVREDQIQVMKSEGVVPSYFVAHTFYWGDWHRDSVLGQARASRISPLVSTINAGVPYTIHNDAPVVPPDMMRLMWTAVNRETRSGQILGPNQRVSPMEALKAVTLNAAYQYFEEDRKGSLEVGKLADMVILSDNPTTINPKAIKDIRIVETLKEGETVFVKE